MSSAFEASVLVLEGKRAKLEREIEVECSTYSQNALTDHIGYKYYSREIENYSAKDECAIAIIESHSLEKIKKKEISIEVYTEKINREIEAIRGQLENYTTKINSDIDAIRNIADVKKQAILDKSSMVKESYLKKMADIEANHKRPISMGFRKKEEALTLLIQQIANSNKLIDAESERKFTKLREKANIAIEIERRNQALEKQQAMELFFANQRAQNIADNIRQDKQNAPGAVSIVDTVYHSSYGVAPTISKPKPVRIAYTGQDITKMSKEEIDTMDGKTMTEEQLDAMADRMEHLSTVPVESKHLNAEYYADKKKERKEAKKIKIES